MDKNDPYKQDAANGNHSMKESIKYPLKRPTRASWSMARTLGLGVNSRKSVLGWVAVLGFQVSFFSWSRLLQLLGMFCMWLLSPYVVIYLDLCSISVFKMMNIYAWDKYVWWIITSFRVWNCIARGSSYLCYALCIMGWIAYIDAYFSYLFTMIHIAQDIYQ